MADFAGGNLFHAKRKLAEHGITITYKREFGEYRINFINGKEATAYYTNDLQDAYHTGLAMAKRSQR